MRTQLVILGAGPGGHAAAFRAADLGMEVTLVDPEPRLGGTCLLRGCIPSKTLLHAAKVMAEAKDLAGFGVRFEPPTVDPDAVRRHKESVVETLANGLAQLAARRKIRVIRAWAQFANSTTLRLRPAFSETLEDAELRFDRAIIATGAVPASLPFLRQPVDRVMFSGGALELPDVPGRLLVIGGGYIGLELATVYAALGSKVNVAEMTEGLLPGADRNLVRPLAKAAEERFDAVLLGTRVIELLRTAAGVRVTFEGQGGESRAEFDSILVAVGRRPRTAGLGLENTRVTIDGRGFVQVDGSWRTADERILAIGDVAGGQMLAHKASHEGKTAVEILAGEREAASPAAVPAVVFTDPEVAWVGLTEDAAKAEGRRIAVAQFPWAASGRAHAVGRTEGLTKWIIDPGTDRILGCGIVGPGAGDLIGEAVLAIQANLTAADVARAIHPHPTLSETLGAAAEVHLGIATDVYRPKRPR